MRIGRALVALSLVVTLTVASPPATRAQLIPADQTQFVGIDYRIEVSGETDVCVDSDYDYIVSVERYATPEEHSLASNQHWGAAAAQVTGTLNGVTSTEPSGPTGRAVFSVHFSAPGTYPLEFTATVGNLAGQPAPEPLTITVTVHDCDWYVTTMSIWYHLPFGFRDWAGAVTRRKALLPDGSGNLIGTGILDTFSIPTVQLPLCAVSVTADDPAVNFTGRASGATNRQGVANFLRIEVDYAVTHVSTTVTCPRSSTTNEADSTVDSFNGNVPIRDGVGVGRALPHNLNANGPNPGVTRLIVELVMR